MGEENTEKNGSENTENKKTTPETTDESKNTENTQKNNENMIPKDRFDAVNTRAIDAEAKLKEITEAKANADKAQLTKDKKFEELSTTLQNEKDQLIAINNGLKLDGTKRDLIDEAITNKIIHKSLTKMITGVNEEEIKASIVEAGEFYKEVNKGVVNKKTATDDSGAGGDGKEKPMSDEDFTKLMKDDPAKAEEYLRKMTP